MGPLQPIVYPPTIIDNPYNNQIYPGYAAFDGFSTTRDLQFAYTYTPTAYFSFTMQADKRNDFPAPIPYYYGNPPYSIAFRTQIRINSILSVQIAQIVLVQLWQRGVELMDVTVRTMRRTLAGRRCLRVAAWCASTPAPLYTAPPTAAPATATPSGALLNFSGELLDVQHDFVFFTSGDAFKLAPDAQIINFDTKQPTTLAVDDEDVCASDLRRVPGRSSRSRLPSIRFRPPHRTPMHTNLPSL